MVDLDLVRRCTLREPVALDLDCVSTALVGVRCLIVAKVVHETCMGLPGLKRDLDASGLIEWLRAESVRRTTGGASSDIAPLARVPAAVAKDRPDAV